LFLGDFAAVEEMLPALRQLLDTIADPEPYGLWLRTVEALLLRYRGALPEATQSLWACTAEARQQNNVPWRYYAAMTVAKAMLEFGLWKEAESILTEYMELYDRSWGTVIARCLLGTLHIRQGQTEDARRLLSETQERFGQRLTAFERESLSLAQAGLAAAEGRWPDALSAFEAAANTQARMGKRWYRAQTLREWAEAYVSRNEPGDFEHARELLQAAQAEFEALNVPSYAAWVGERLQAL
jgi:tetratricopeptide (TPR) repeat protein